MLSTDGIISDQMVTEGLRVHYPEATSMALFGSRATGKATPSSNADVLIFQKHPPQTGWGTEQHLLRDLNVKVDLLPNSMLRSHRLFSGTLEHEVFFSTIHEARVLFELEGEFSRFASEVSPYPDFLRRNVGLARTAKYNRARKVVAKALLLEDVDLLQSFVPHLIEHAAHVFLAEAGVYATRNWLSRLKTVDAVAYRRLVHLYGSQDGKHRRDLEEAVAVLAPHVMAACRPLIEFMATATSFRQISEKFSAIDVYDLEILTQTLRTDLSEGGVGDLLAL